MNHSSRFWDRLARRYAKQPIKDEATYQEKLRRTRQYLSADMDVVEMGCGTGSTALEHAPFVKRLTATDVSPEMIDIARGKAKTANINNVSFDVATATGTELAASSVDAVLALNLLHLLEDHQAAIAHAFQGLKPGGVFVTSTACIGDMPWILRMVLPVGKFLRLIPHLAFFTRDEFEQNLTAAGFILEESWLPGKNKAVFTVARKPQHQTTASSQDDT